MKKLILFLTLAALAVPQARARSLRVITTTTDLKSLTELIGGDRVEVSSITLGSEDPHYLEAKPSFMLRARRADLWIRIGLELEIGWEPLILEGSRNARIHVGRPGHLDASQGVLRLEVPKARLIPTLRHIHRLGNPHCWLDPLNARIMARNIADRLAQLSPAEAEHFRASLKAFDKRLDEAMFGRDLVEKVGGQKLWGLELRGTLAEHLEDQKLELGGWAATMRPCRGAKIVTYHRSWSYFANRFGLAVAAELEPSPGVPPSPRHLRDVIETIKAEKIRVLLMEPFYSRRAPDLVAARTGVQVLVVTISVGGQPGVDDYFALIDNVVNRLAAALGGKS